MRFPVHGRKKKAGHLWEKASFLRRCPPFSFARERSLRPPSNRRRLFVFIPSFVADCGSRAVTALARVWERAAPSVPFLILFHPGQFGSLNANRISFDHDCGISAQSGADRRCSGRICSLSDEDIPDTAGQPPLNRVQERPRHRNRQIGICGGNDEINQERYHGRRQDRPSREKSEYGRFIADRRDSGL